jgi:hypothetical protein
MNKLAMIIAIGCSFNLTGCYAQTFDANGWSGSSYALTRDAKAKVIGHLSTQSHQWYIVNGLIPLGGESLDSILSREAHGQAVQGLSIHTEQSFWDVLIPTAVSGGIGLLLTSVLGSAPANGSAAAIIIPLVAVGIGLLIPQFRTITVEGDVLDKPASK